MSQDPRIIELLTEIRDLLKPKERKKVEKVNGIPKLAELWNINAHERFRKIAGVSAASARYKSAVARWEEKADEWYWVGVIQRINRSSFCLGGNSRKWTATFEWLIRPDTHHKVVEGVYDDKTVEDVHEVVGYLPDGTAVKGRRK